MKKKTIILIILLIVLAITVVLGIRVAQKTKETITPEVTTETQDNQASVEKESVNKNELVTPSPTPFEEPADEPSEEPTTVPTSEPETQTPEEPYNEEDTGDGMEVEDEMEIFQDENTEGGLL